MKRIYCKTIKDEKKLERYINEMRQIEDLTKEEKDLFEETLRSTFEKYGFVKVL